MDIDNGDGTQTRVWVEDGKLVSGTRQDPTPINEHAQALHNIGEHGSSDMRLAARVSFVDLERWLNAQGVTWAEFTQSEELKRRFLNDSNREFPRIWTGRV